MSWKWKENGHEKKAPSSLYGFYRQCDNKSCGTLYATKKHKEGEAAVYRSAKYCSPKCQKEAREALTWNNREQT